MFKVLTIAKLTLSASGTVEITSHSPVKAHQHPRCPHYVTGIHHFLGLNNFPKSHIVLTKQKRKEKPFPKIARREMTVVSERAARLPAPGLCVACTSPDQTGDFPCLRI